MKRIAIPFGVAVLLLVITALVGCGPGTGATGTVPINTIVKSKQSTPGAATLNVFMLKGDTLTEVLRTAQGDADLVQQALNDLLAGPTAAEKAMGLNTAIPAGTKLLSYSVSGGKATADFSKEMLNFGGGSARVQAILGQIDNTIKANDPTVKSVSVTVEGKPAEEAIQP